MESLLSALRLQENYIIVYKGHYAIVYPFIMFELVMLVIWKYCLQCFIYILQKPKLKITVENVNKELKKLLYDDKDSAAMWRPYTKESPIPEHCIKAHITRKTSHSPYFVSFWDVFESCPHIPEPPPLPPPREPPPLPPPRLTEADKKKAWDEQAASLRANYWKSQEEFENIKEITADWIVNDNGWIVSRSS